MAAQGINLERIETKRGETMTKTPQVTPDWNYTIAGIKKAEHQPTKKPWEGYDLSITGTIQNPGKFEGEQAYVPYFWDCYLDGGASTDDGEVLGFRVEGQDIERFPELAKVEWIFLMEDDQGFVSELQDGPRD
jgi:hypothetical protein